MQPTQLVSPGPVSRPMGRSGGRGEDLNQVSCRHPLIARVSRLRPSRDDPPADPRQLGRTAPGAVRPIQSRRVRNVALEEMALEGEEFLDQTVLSTTHWAAVGWLARRL